MMLVHLLLGAIAWCMLVGAIKGVYMMIGPVPDLWMQTSNLISTLLFAIAFVCFGGMAVLL
ncbi:hypothetical protein [Rhizobium sp. SGZ-381]|uniref:hypothetical protein n=1 Tax=Rhizobium sp. SGZ-381 TaxID=3342800 RepID=UPI003671EA44